MPLSCQLLSSQQLSVNCNLEHRVSQYTCLHFAMLIEEKEESIYVFVVCTKLCIYVNPTLSNPSYLCVVFVSFSVQSQI